MTALPLAPPVTPPTIAWDAAVLLVAGGILAYEALRASTTSSSTSTTTATTTTGCVTQTKKPCPPCVPPVGTEAYEIHRVPPSRPHWPCPGDHIHWFMRMQNPNNCQCFWKRDYRPVTCLGPGQTPPIPPGSVPI